MSRSSGLGHFGSSLANELMHRGWDVLGIDTGILRGQSQVRSKYGVAVVGIKRPVGAAEPARS